jgi:hypothetical protein
VSDVNMSAAYQGRAGEAEAVRAALRASDLAVGRLERRTNELEGLVRRIDRELKRLQRRILVMEKGYVLVAGEIEALGGHPDE